MMPFLEAIITGVPQSADNKHVRTAALYAYIYKCLALHDATETNYRITES